MLSMMLLQAKMGMMEDFEVSLQVLRGFDTDISFEVNEIKVPHSCCRRTFVLQNVDGKLYKIRVFPVGNVVCVEICSFK